MNPDPPKFSVIVPTRERCDTLKYTLMSLQEQVGSSYEIIVSDNCSTDATQKVVQEIATKQTKYIRTSERCSMAENWEYATSHAQGEYITIIGDDDTLVPNALRDLEIIINRFEPDIIGWEKIEYCWPNHPSLPGYFSIPIRKSLFKMNSELMVKAVFNGHVSYSRTPTLYNAVVKRSLMEKLHQKSGRYFWAGTPDVYSGVAVLSQTPSYLYSLRPFSVNGASGHSNGTAFLQDHNSEKTKKFYLEMDDRNYPNFPSIPGSIQSLIYEAFFQASAKCFKGKVQVSKRAMVDKVIEEVSKLDKETYERTIRSFKDSLFLKMCHAQIERAIQHHPFSGHKDFANQNLTSDSNYIRFSLSEDSVPNVQSAANFCSAFLDDYSPPKEPQSFNAFNLALSWMSRKIIPKLAKRIL